MKQVKILKQKKQRKKSQININLQNSMRRYNNQTTNKHLEIKWQ